MSFTSDFNNKETSLIYLAQMWTKAVVWVEGEGSEKLHWNIKVHLVLLEEKKSFTRC